MVSAGGALLIAAVARFCGATGIATHIALYRALALASSFRDTLLIVRKMFAGVVFRVGFLLGISRFVTHVGFLLSDGIHFSDMQSPT
jgi:hypothetical protein